MTRDDLALEWIPGKYALARYNESDELPPWALDSHVLMTVTRTNDALSILAPDHLVPFNAEAERGFIALRIAGSLDFTQYGIIAKVTRPLADAKIPIIALSTYETDIILFKDEYKETAVKVLATVADVSRL